ncbi:MAG: adenosylcobinamide-GDP ribazoletransferase [Chloroflexi bacterium]|nr:MAG: adenosylcobinamide-GDP ribazoletransferase [Chloroflexota bacterium]
MSFLIALQFLTRIPVPFRRQVAPAEIGHSMSFFPLVGALIGLLLIGAHWPLNWLFPPLLASALTLAWWIALSGGLHWDGFIDCCDGLIVATSPEKRLRILRDTRIGTYGAVGAAMLLLIKFLALDALPGDWRWGALLLSPTLGRWAMVYATSRFPCARREGMGRVFKDHAGWRELLLATVTALLVALLAHWWKGPLAVAMVLLSVHLVVAWTLTRIPGLTGDVYGALCEISEVVVLLLAVALGKHGL